MTFPSLSGLQVFRVSVFLCVPVSAIIHSLVFELVKNYPSASPGKDIILVLAMGVLVGSLKSLMVSGVAYLVRPSLRLQLIVGNTVLFSLLETWFYYEIWTWTFPFG